MYSCDYDGQDVTLVVENQHLISFQITYADDFVYWTSTNQQLERVEVGVASSTVTSISVSLRTESNLDSSFYSLAAVSTLHRPTAGSH